MLSQSFNRLKTVKAENKCDFMTLWLIGL